MRAPASFVALAVAILILALAAVPSASAAPPNDACALVTQAQMSAALGVPIGTGQHVVPTFTKECTWTPTGGATKDVKYATVSFQDPTGYAMGKMVAQQAQAKVNKEEGAGSMAADSASGIGDDAYYTSMGTGYTALLLKKGNVALKVAIYGEMPVAKKKAAEKTLALNALSKL
jgi:hypothetical protein